MVITEVRNVVAALWSDGRGWILLTVAAGWSLSLGMRLVFPALAPFFRADFGLSLTAAGLLLTVLWGAYALGQLPGGALGDHIGEGRVMVYSTAISAVTLVLLSASTDVWMLFAGTILFGLSTALYGPTRFTIFTDIYPKRAGSAIGLTMAAGSAGNTMLPVVAVSIALYASWRYSIVFVVPLLLLVAVALWVAVPKRTSSEHSVIDELSFETVRRVVKELTRGKNPAVTAVQTVETFAFQGFVSFFPTYLILAKGLEPDTAATLYALFFACSFIVQPISGASNDLFGPKPTLILILGLSAAAMWILPFTQGFIIITLLTIGASALSGTAVVTQTYLADSLPENMKGTGLGLIRTGFILLGATSPTVVGFLGDYGYFNEGFLLLAVFLSVGAILSAVFL